MIRYPSHQQLNNRRRRNVILWNLKRRHSVDNINAPLREWGLVDNLMKEEELIRTVENLDCPKLYYLLKSQKTMLELRVIPVSYTHLTLPTICSV